MAHKTLIDGTVYDIKGGKTLVDGTERAIANGKTLIDGTEYDVTFSKPCTLHLRRGADTQVYINGEIKPFKLTENYAQIAVRTGDVVKVVVGYNYSSCNRITVKYNDDVIINKYSNTMSPIDPSDTTRRTVEKEFVVEGDCSIRHFGTVTTINNADSITSLVLICNPCVQVTTDIVNRIVIDDPVFGSMEITSPIYDFNYNINNVKKIIIPFMSTVKIAFKQPTADVLQTWPIGTYTINTYENGIKIATTYLTVSSNWTSYGVEIIMSEPNPVEYTVKYLTVDFKTVCTQSAKLIEHYITTA